MVAWDWALLFGNFHDVAKEMVQQSVTITLSCCKSMQEITAEEPGNERGHHSSLYDIIRISMAWNKINKRLQ